MAEKQINFDQKIIFPRNNAKNGYQHLSSEITSKSNKDEDDIRGTKNGGIKSEIKGSNGNTPTRTTKKSTKIFREKFFEIRESYLTALLEVDHIKTIKHIIYAIFLLYFLHNIKHDYFVKGRVNFGLEAFKNGFSNLHYVLGVWLIQNIFVCSIYYFLNVWLKVRSKLDQQKTLQRYWSLSCLLLYISTQVIFLYVPGKICLRLDLQVPEATGLLVETCRMLMKMHAFVRTICGRAMQERLKTREMDSGSTSTVAWHLPPFRKYLYYLFAPTFLYSDNYPRTSAIRWKFVATRLLEAVAITFLNSFIYEVNIKPNFSDFGRVNLPAGYFITRLVRMLLPSMAIYVGGFYFILHAWLNFTAELLRFGDRMFYRDWWTSGNYDNYFRNWNIVVSDWLYEYVYKELGTTIFRGSKAASLISVYFISALLHEYVLIFALQVCFPVMFLMFFVCGVSFVYLTRRFSKNMGNIFLWFTLIYGFVLIVTLYSMEYYTSRNCPKESYDSWSDILVPHLWSCYMK